MGDAINQLVQGFLQLINPIVIPDWGALVSLIPILLLIGVVGPLISLLVFLWFVYVVRAPRDRLKYVEPAPYAAPIVAGAPAYPVGEPYCATDRLVYPAGSTRCRIDGHELAVVCPKCGAGRVAAESTCGQCGLVLRIEPRAVQLVTAGPPPGGAAVA